MTQIIILWKQTVIIQKIGGKKTSLIRIHPFSRPDSQLPSGLLTEAFFFFVSVRRQVPRAELTRSNRGSTLGNLQTDPSLSYAFFNIVPGTKKQDNNREKRRQLLSSPAAFCKRRNQTLASSRCELHRFLVLMLLLCARRKVLWSGTDLYQSMQMLDVGAGAGEGGTSTRTPDCHPWQAGN